MCVYVYFHLNTKCYAVAFVNIPSLPTHGINEITPNAPNRAKRWIFGFQKTISNKDLFAAAMVAVGPSFPLFGNVWLTLIWPACEAHRHFKWRGCCVYLVHTHCLRWMCARLKSTTCLICYEFKRDMYESLFGPIHKYTYISLLGSIFIFIFVFRFSSFFPFLFRFSFLLQQNELKWKRKKKKMGNRPVNTMLAQINKKSYIFVRVLAFLLLSIAWQNKEKILGGVGMPGIWNWKYVCKWRSLQENTF